jgi:hypothetical protein
MKRHVWIILALSSGWAGAHPVDEVIQGAYLTLVPGLVQLELDITPGSRVTMKVLGPLDGNGDQTITDAEARAYAVRVVAQSSLKLDGVAVLWTVDRVSVPPYQNLQTGYGTLKIYATGKCPERAGTRTLTYQNRYKPSKSQWVANIFLQPADDWKFQVAKQRHSSDGRQLTVDYTATRP